jgi:hypothetical protein
MSLFPKTLKNYVIIGVFIFAAIIGGIVFIWYNGSTDQYNQENDFNEVEQNEVDEEDTSMDEGDSIDDEDQNDDTDSDGGGGDNDGEDESDTDGQTEGVYKSDYYDFQMNYPADMLSIETFDNPPKEDEWSTLVRLNYIENKLSKPIITLKVAKTDMTVVQWFNSHGYCPDNTDLCSEPLNVGPTGNSIQFKELNRHYGGISTLFKIGENIFEYHMGARNPDSAFSDEEIELYQDILDSIKF